MLRKKLESESGIRIWDPESESGTEIADSGFGLPSLQQMLFNRNYTTIEWFGMCYVHNQLAITDRFKLKFGGRLSNCIKHFLYAF